MPDPSQPVATILVVDDEAAIRDVIHRILVNEGYRVVAAEDGADALRAADLHGSAFDLLLTDLKMPRMNGVQLADALRERHPGLRVLFLTAHADMLFGDREMLEDNTAYLEKPVTAKGLNEAVRLLVFGSVAGHADRADRPVLDDLRIATEETEYLRVTLSDGGQARVLFTGGDPTAADLEQVIDSLSRHVAALRDSEH